MESSHRHQRRNPSSSASLAEITRISNLSPSTRIDTSDNYAPDWKLRRSNLQQRQQKEEKVNEDDPNNVSSIIGICPFMCPEGERAQRERLRDLAVFERLNGNHGKTSAELAVKKFCRTISTKHVKVSDVRPLPVLGETLNYLLKVLDSKEHSFEVVHDFIFDRTRSIRQDLSMQNIVSDEAIYMYEEMVKFHVISHHRLRCSGSSISSMHHLNMEQLTKALNSLFNLYEVNRNLNSIYEKEAEFRSLYVLLRLDSDSQPMGESHSLWFCRLPSTVMRSKEMCFARRVLRFFSMCNYKGFFCTTAAEASYLQYCILEPYINEVRVLAVSCINSVGYKLHPYPLAQLSKLLMMKESDVESFCNACGLETCTDDAGNKLLPTKQTTFCRPKGGFQSYSFFGVERFERFAEKAWHRFPG